MKLLIVVADGAADEAYEELGMQTPLQAAKTPWMDRVVAEGAKGLVEMQHSDLPIGSQTAFLSLLGSDPHVPGLDRSYFEALALNVKLGLSDVVFRCNVVRVDKAGRLADFTAGQISDRAALAFADRVLGDLPPSIEFYHTKSYRNLLVWRNCPYKAWDFDLLPPHENPGASLFDVRRRGGSPIHDIPAACYDSGLTLWPWGASKCVDIIQTPYALGVVTALEFLAGMAQAAGGEAIIPRWATGYANTHYEGKVLAAQQLLSRCEVVIVHCNAPDEEAHVGNLQGKIKALEDIDDLVGSLFVYLTLHHADWRLVVTTDHYTVCRTRQHKAGPCPYGITGSDLFYIPSFSEIIPKQFGKSLIAEGAILAWLGRS